MYPIPTITLPHSHHFPSPTLEAAVPRQPTTTIIIIPPSPSSPPLPHLHKVRVVCIYAPRVRSVYGWHEIGCSSVLVTDEECALVSVIAAGGEGGFHLAHGTARVDSQRQRWGWDILRVSRHNEGAIGFVIRISALAKGLSPEQGCLVWVNSQVALVYQPASAFGLPTTEGPLDYISQKGAFGVPGQPKGGFVLS
ncbi:hypothetical protein Tco_0971437 [Tanacetum coccineum]